MLHDDLFPAEDFKENAEKRVRLDLLFSALIKKYALEVQEEDINKFIEEEARNTRMLSNLEHGFKANLSN